MKFVKTRKRIPRVKRIVVKLNGYKILDMLAEMGVVMSMMGNENWRYSQGVLEMNLRGRLQF